MNKSESIKELATALSKAQGEMKPAKKDSTNPFFKSNYADLASVWEVCRKPLSDNGLSVSQITHNSEKGIVLETVLLHSSGEWLSGEIAVTPLKNEPQAIGSAITYARRYALSAILGIAADDDDAEVAMAREDKPTTKPSTPVVPVKSESGKITESQTKAIYAVIKEKGIPTEEVRAYMKDAFSANSLKDLTEAQAAQLINDISSGKIVVKEVQTAKSGLVKEAEKLGGKIIKEDVIDKK